MGDVQRLEICELADGFRDFFAKVIAADVQCAKSADFADDFESAVVEFIARLVGVSA